MKKFQEIYKRIADEKPVRRTEQKEEPLLTFSASEMPLKSFLRWITDQTSTSIICHVDLDDKQVTVNVKDVTLTDLLATVSRRMGMDLTQQGNIYYMGAIKPEDRGILVRKVRRLDATGLQAAIATLKTDIGQSVTFADGLLIVGEKVRNLQKIHDMLDLVESTESDTWILQLHIISLQDTLTNELGFNTSTSLDIATTFANNGGYSTTAAGALSAILRAAQESNRADIIAQPMMLLMDGDRARFQDGETIPVPKKTTSYNGTITTDGFEYVNTGVIVNTQLREVSVDKARCTLNVELTSIKGYVEYAPITNGQKFSTTAVLESGGVYLLGSMKRTTKTNNRSGSFFPTLKKDELQDGDVQIWARCYKISGSLDKDNSNE